MKSVKVKLLSGGHRTPDGVHHRPDDADPTFTVKRSVYEAFKFKFEPLGESDEPVILARALPNNVEPKALHLIKAHDVDWAHIKGSGKSGRILQSDVEKYLGIGVESDAVRMTSLERENAELRTALEMAQNTVVAQVDVEVVSEVPSVSKAAARRAELDGVDLSTVTGTGRNGTITLADVKAAKV